MTFLLRLTKASFVWPMHSCQPTYASSFLQFWVAKSPSISNGAMAGFSYSLLAQNMARKSRQKKRDWSNLISRFSSKDSSTLVRGCRWRDGLLANQNHLPCVCFSSGHALSTSGRTRQELASSARRLSGPLGGLRVGCFVGTTGRMMQLVLTHCFTLMLGRMQIVIFG